MRSFLISFVLTALFTPVVIALARRWGWVARPRADRWHAKPTALMGGVAIFLGTVSAWLLTGDLTSLLPVAVPAAGLFLVGIVDDRVRELRPHHRLIAQVAAGAALVTAGVRFESLPLWLALTLTLAWVVGITNAVNLLDNMDGLAAGVSGIAGLALVGCCMAGGDAGTASAVLALAGACAGFLLYNFNPARIFMGDCGSMFIGFTLAALAVQGAHRGAPNLVVSLLVPVALLAIPIFDTTLVTVTRTLHGRPISQGGRDHTSHRMVALGLSERNTALVLYALTALFGGVALLAARVPALVVLLLAVLLLTGLLILGLYLGFLQVYPEGSQVPLHARLLGGRLLHKKQLLQVLLDILLIPAAFVGAALLRFEGELPAAIARGMLAALPMVLAGKLMGLALCRAYRGVWRYAGLVDAMTAVAGSTAGSLLTGLLLGLRTGFVDLSRCALIIDWLLFTFLIVAVRTGYSVLRELFASLQPRDGAQVLILGVGEETLALIQQLRDPLAAHRTAIGGILDDDPGKQRRTLNGVPVVGPIRELPALLRGRSVTYCLLGVSPHSEQGRSTLEFCRRERIPVYPHVGALPLALPAATAGGERIEAAAA